jgi:hypothetical protein
VPRRRAHIAFFASVFATGHVACTLLARFDDLPPRELADGGAEAGLDGVAPALDSASDTESAPPDAGPDVDPCSGHVNGSYCGTDGLDDPALAGDLVRCDGGAVAEVIACDGGCLALSNPFPDTCNGCNVKPNGTYCGRDFSTFPASDADWLIQCQSGNAAQKVACQHGCLSNGAAASCAP